MPRVLEVYKGRTQGEIERFLAGARVRITDFRLPLGDDLYLTSGGDHITCNKDWPPALNHHGGIRLILEKI